MSNVSGLKGYNVRLDGQLLNSTPIPDGQPFPYVGAISATDYSDRITITAIDNAGHETDPVTLRELGETLITTNPAPTDLLPQATRDTIDGFVAQYLKPNDVTDGAIIGIYTEEGSYYKAFGGDRTSGLTLTLDHKMRYGSCTKMYTALLVLAQIDAGHLSLDDKLSQYVSGVANGDKITIKHLLMMQSGIEDYLQQDASVAQSYFLTPTANFDPLPKIRSYTPLYDPGTQSSYSNSNYILLGMILEWCDATYGTGRDIRTILMEDCLVPLGLTETEWPTGNYMAAPYARGWAANLALPQIQAMLGPFAFLAGLLGYPTTAEIEWTAVSTTWAGSAGAFDGTVADAIKFGQALASGALLSPAMKQLREETFVTYVTYTPANVWDGPGWMGFGLGVIQWGSWLGWVGNLGGYKCTLFANPTNGAVVVVMMNHMAAQDVELFYRIAYLLYPETTVIQPSIVRPSGIPSSARVGTPSVYVYHAPGDQDAKHDVALKVPFYI
ncbi:serine hydrolase domain-containing protein [Mycobacterium intracellulare]|uniref:serine hydrolase domain-containing protein n=1 Tax=Mycobacterium intracellulare TaxID=1767 RepID=UPI00080B3FC9|nr:serine hydrolase domain-containing protein [Mycobacterium intracellulare]OCB15071.1 D-alanyl-D-alanine carboxypeptidase [Mycobacterium intracellulare subsp. yongonense]